MSAYIQLPGIDGEVNDSAHKKWVEVNAVSLPIHRSIANGAVGVARSNGETSLGDIVVTKTWDSSTPKLAAFCASGKFLPTVTIHLCTDIGGKNCVNLEVKLSNVIISSYSFSGTGDQSPVPSEVATLNYTKIEWMYTKYNQMGGSAGQVPASYDTEESQVTGN
jgi:type VI secretion system secreted protein Hcp